AIDLLLSPQQEHGRAYGLASPCHAHRRGKGTGGQSISEDDRGMSSLRTEVVIVGGGPAGLTAAIALASAGVETALVASSQAAADHRTSALLQGSVNALETLRVWEYCRDHAAPLRVMRIIDDTGRLVRAREACFAASEIGLDAFGHNIENRFLVAALEARAR